MAQLEKWMTKEINFAMQCWLLVSGEWAGTSPGMEKGKASADLRTNSTKVKKYIQFTLLQEVNRIILKFY